MKNKNLLLVDFNNVLYRSVYGHYDLSYNGNFTGGIFGFIDMVCSVVNRYDVDRIVVCNDTKPYCRSEFFPAYKTDRKEEKDQEKKERILAAKNQIKDFIYEFRIPMNATAGVEADDFIGMYCREDYIHDKIFIMSNDSDFYQLLNGTTFLVKTKGLYGKVDFKKEFPKLKIKDWPRVVALKGSHNGVPGIKMVGEKTAIKIIRLSADEIKTKYKETLKDQKLKTDLATFPFPHFPKKIVRLRPRKIRYNANKLDKFCFHYGIRFRDDYHSAFMRLS